MVLLASRSIGNAGTMEIHDDGWTVTMRVRSSDPATYNGSLPISVYMNGSWSGWFGVNYPSGSPWVNVWVGGVGSSQTVGFQVGDSGTWGFGSGGALTTWVSRATVPAAPTPIGVDQATANSLRYRFSGNSDGGSPIREWQIGYGTDPSNVQYTVSSSGTSTIGNLASHTTWYFWSRGRNDVGWGPWSTRSQGDTLGHPTVPLNLAATPSASVTGRVALTWNQPTTTGAGGIVGYNIFRDGTQIATTTGTATGYTDNGLTPYQSYSYTVAARNAYSNSVSGTGPQTAAVAAVAPGPPAAPTNLTGQSSTTVPGQVSLSWTAPTTTGAGGITGYTVRLADGTLIQKLTGTATTYTVSNLTPGVAYTFVVTARNALADAEGSESAYSNQVIVTPIGEPAAPTNVSAAVSTTTSNRIVVSWTAPPGSLSGFNIFSRVNGADTLIGTINNTNSSFAIDNLTAGTSYTYVVRARTIYTDTLSPGYPGSWGGPASAPVTATATVNNTQTVPGLSAVASATNAIFNGTYVISQITANTIRYNKAAADIPSTASGGSITNITNALFNGTFTISTPTSTTLTYAKTNSNVGPLPTSGGTATDNTNVSLNGTFVVTAVNVGANLLSYANSGANISSVSVPVNPSPGQSGFVKNLSNAVFNGTGFVITAITATTLSYAKTNANVAESNASGTVTNTTNKNIFNGKYTVTTVPAYNVVRYAKTTSDIALRTWFEPNGLVSRTVSPSTLDIKFRSGWAG